MERKGRSLFTTDTAATYAGVLGTLGGFFGFAIELGSNVLNLDPKVALVTAL